MTDLKHIFVAVQWSESGAFELVALPDEGPAVSVSPWAADNEGLRNLKQLLERQGEDCLIVVDGERDSRLLRDLLDVSAFEVVNAAPRLRLCCAWWPMLGFYAGNQRALAPCQDAESDARAIRMGWRSSKEPPTARNPYVRDDLELHILMFAKRFLRHDFRMVLEILEVPGLTRYTMEHGSRLAARLEHHVAGRTHGELGDYSEWVEENRLALFTIAHTRGSLEAQARDRRAKALRFLLTLDEQEPSATVHLSYCTKDCDDEGWDSQALLEVALGLRQSRRRVGTS